MGTPKSFIFFSEFHGFSMKHGPHRLKRNDGFISLMEPLRQRNHDVLNIEKDAPVKHVKILWFIGY